MSELNGKLHDAEPPENHGGEVGEPQQEVLVLSRTELALLRKNADRIPFTEEERRETADVVMQTMRIAKSLRTRISAAKTFASLERINVSELGLHLKNQVNQVNLYPQGQASTTVNVQVNNQVVVNPDKAKFLEKAKEYDQASEPINGSPES